MQPGFVVFLQRIRPAIKILIQGAPTLIQLRYWYLWGLTLVSF